MGMTANQLSLVRYVAENNLQKAKEAALACCVEDQTQKNRWATNRYEHILRSGAMNLIELPANISSFATMEDLSNSIDAVEIREEERNHLQELGVNVMMGDYLHMDIDKKYDFIIGNPPFGQAMEFIEKSLTLLKPTGTLAFLLRTAFLESDKRFSFWQNHPLTGLYTLHKRPSFTGKGTDATSYSWFVWQPQEDQQTIKVI